MYIAVDDTYGPESTAKSKYVTGDRRTHVAVIFQDRDVAYVRNEIAKVLEYLSEQVDTEIKELHFSHIYNRKGKWGRLTESKNIAIFEAFFHIYSRYRWPIELQTVDARTIKDFGNKIQNIKVDGLKLTDWSDLSLLLLCINLKTKYKVLKENLTLIVDEGRHKPGTIFGQRIFHDWPAGYVGYYASSEEPLLQIADFIAFSINRCTNICLKESKTDLDLWFLDTAAKSEFNCPDLMRDELRSDFTVEDFDKLHYYDRRRKGLEPDFD